MKFFNFLLYSIFVLMTFLKCFAISKQDIQDESSYWIIGIGILFIFSNLRLLKKSLIFLMFSFLLSLCFSLPYVSYYLSFNDFLNSLLFPLLFITSYIFFRKYPKYIFVLKYLGLIAIILGYFNLIRLSSMINENATRAMQSNAGNTMVALLPFAFLWKNKIIKYAIVILVFYACLISIKRSSFVIFIGVIYMYMLLRNKINIYKGLLKYTLIILFVGLLILPHIDVAANMINRMSESIDDGGSGRDELVVRCLNFQKESTFVEWIVGHGYLSFSEDSRIKLNLLNTGAHNDFVEILYDAGIIAYILFLLILYKMFKITKKLRKEMDSVLIPFASCYIVLVLASMFVGPFVHFWYYLPMYILFGAMYSLISVKR